MSVFPSKQKVAVVNENNADSKRRAFLAAIPTKRAPAKGAEAAVKAAEKAAAQSILFEYTDLPIRNLLRQAIDRKVDAKIIAGWQLRHMQGEAWDAVVYAHEEAKPYYWQEMLKISSRFHRLSDKPNLDPRTPVKYTMAETMDFIERRSALGEILTIGSFDARKTFWAYVHMRNQDRIPREVIHNVDVYDLMAKYLDNLPVKLQEAA